MTHSRVNQALLAAEEPGRVRRSHVLAPKAGKVGLLCVLEEVVDWVDLRCAVCQDRQTVIVGEIGRVVIADH